MSDIVQQCCNQDCPTSQVIEFSSISFNDPHQFSCVVEHANGMCKPRMSCSGENKLRQTKLTYSSQPLHLMCIDELPSKLVNWIPFLEQDQVMNWVTESLCFHRDFEYHSCVQLLDHYDDSAVTSSKITNEFELSLFFVRSSRFCFGVNSAVCLLPAPLSLRERGVKLNSYPP